MTNPIDNRLARHIFLDRQGLSRAPNRLLGRQGLLELIETLGFVQVDSIQTVERAHHQILFSRNQTYRREDLAALLETDRSLFEHWTHDAAVIPSAFFPYWKHRFIRREERIRARWALWQGRDYEAAIAQTYRRICDTGPVLAREVKEEDHKSGGWWNWHPSKTALEFLWHTGKLSITRRENFQKVYDLSERVIPADHFAAEVDEAAFVDWACRAALARLGFATSGEIAAFFDLISPKEAKEWVIRNRDALEEVTLQTADGRLRPSFALADQLASLHDVPEPPARLRVLSPFDPLLRDRDRAERLFGFSYRIEVFVPEPKRQYGYYVFPLLEGERMVGRIDMKADRRAGALVVKRLWWEKGVRDSAARQARLEAELQRLARFTGVERIEFLPDWRG
ncbi:winged helix-turn-helix domain-containing protein [Rhizobium sp. SSA_523]|uniref:winged helix-turn-helix domain-containing protein n=1 Tax=Rhizobium sp. SSA_523 TaxID=2952477 RepID=UPI00209155B5|nr:winged helix-turn-helix domain-containing protein [Rhizobium sp. SSA_523]MCO5731071.1 winged helix-turn-helix domain-containing protein [Rhizobium sp. SSA_523]WKC24128.1 winged helix-turn-helix domain-containing protein [Rhizobium sp. SSA_523]